MYIPEIVEPVSFEDVERTVNILVEGGRLKGRELTVMGQVNVSEVQRFLLSLG